MRYTDLTVENFRIFFGQQDLHFPDERGVVILYGLNGKGKTSFLNAIRWAWTGKVRHRGNRTVDEERLINREAIALGDNGPVVCRVRLRFRTDATRWDLSRVLCAEDGELTHDLTLLRDGVALNASDRDRRLAELMPAEIEQFFLFDGELLDQYEKLVDDDGSGSLLRESIERILGVPVVQNAARDMRALADEAGKAIAEAAKHGKRTRELGQHLEQAQQLATSHRDNRDTEELRISELEANFRDAEEQVADQQSKLELLGRRNQLRVQLKDLRRECGEVREAFSAALAQSWRGVLVDPVAAAVDALETTLETDRAQLADVTVADLLGTTYRESGELNCPACDSSLDDRHRTHLTHLLRLGDGETLAELQDRVQRSAERVRTLRGLIDETSRAELRRVEDTYRAVDVKVGDVEEELTGVDEQLKDTPTGELENLVKRREDLRLMLARAKETYDEQNERFGEMSDRVTRLRQQIEATGGGNADPVVVARENLTRDMASLFEQAVTAYRDTLKENVQEKASELFRTMRSETDFRKLVINDQYGLRILDSRGQAVEDRSAGYEHLVALSLLGALQACSPISGPIVMDSPFGRLDPEHVRNVVSQLNELSDQVFLLVHEGEIDREAAQFNLRARLLTEYELRRVNAYHTNIEELRES